MMVPETLTRLSLAILLLPLLSFVTLIFMGKKLSRQGDWLGTSILFVCLALAIVVLVNKLTVFARPVTFSYPWVNFGNVPLIGPLGIQLGVTVDNLSAIMMVVVCLV